MPSTLMLLVSTNVVLATFGIIVIIYRLHFHPLAKIPGPLGNKLSGWPHGWAASSGQRHIWLYTLHQRYGPTVRVSPNTVSISTATAVRDIYGSRKSSVRKGKFYQTIQTAEGGLTTFTTRDETLHARKRRLLSHAFSERAMQDSEQYVSKNISKWLDQLGAGPLSKDGWTTAKNVATWVNYLTFDILTDLAYGRSFDLLNSNDMRFTVDLLPKATEGTYIIGFHPFNRFMRWFLYRTIIGAWLAGPIVRDMQRINTTSAKFMAERKSLEMSGDSTSTRKDFFFHLFRGRDSETGRGYTEAELASESNLLLIAGSDTAATTLCACTFYLIRHPDVLQTLRQELASHFSSLEEINYTGTGLGNLPYLRGVIDESMRLNPPVGGHLGRAVIGTGIVVDDFFYPAGVEVGVPIYALHHNTDYYPDPYAFKPERWIVNEKAGWTKEMVERAQSAFFAFSIGPRGCIGKNLAYMELSLAVARLVWKFDLQESPGWNEALGGGLVSSSGEYLTRDGFVAQRNGPVVKFRERTN